MIINNGIKLYMLLKILMKIVYIQHISLVKDMLNINKIKVKEIKNY